MASSAGLPSFHYFHPPSSRQRRPSDHCSAPRCHSRAGDEGPQPHALLYLCNIDDLHLFNYFLNTKSFFSIHVLQRTRRTSWKRIWRCWEREWRIWGRKSDGFRFRFRYGSEEWKNLMMAGGICRRSWMAVVLMVRNWKMVPWFQGVWRWWVRLAVLLGLFSLVDL